MLNLTLLVNLSQKGCGVLINLVKLEWSVIYLKIGCDESSFAIIRGVSVIYPYYFL